MPVYSHVTSQGIPIQEIIDNLFNKKRGGFYVELGAHDGLIQSNTAFLEFERGWSGVLIEPSPNAFAECKRNRPGSQCFSYACVNQDYLYDFVEGDFNGSPMSSVDGKRCNSTNTIRVLAKPLSMILDLANIQQPIDLLSLDVEGYELNVLNGLCFKKYRPHYMLIEIYNDKYEDICVFLKNNNYSLITNVTQYNHKDNPHWDGTHNDYLFVDNHYTVYDEFGYPY